ncbi:MAG: DNA polymerase III subunit beta [Clostridia bacterium]|nr:DNA polymerase III subunit beta [Clostridia bacterium]
MRLYCDTAALASACQNVSHAASTKTAIPAIEGILLVAKNQTLYLTGYDLEMGITTSISANVEEEGALVINAHMFSETLRKLPADVVAIDSDTRNIASIRSGAFSSTLIGISAEEYPELPAVMGGYPVEIEQTLLKDMIRKTIFSVAAKDSKIVHTGIRFEVRENHLRLIAVDGVRLAIRNEEIVYDGEDLTFVVPAKTLSEVIKLMSDEEEPIRIGVGKRHIEINVGNYGIISRLLDGEFLKYESAIPDTAKTVITVDTRQLMDCVDRTSLIITDKIKSPIKCTFEDNEIQMSCISSLGTAQDRMECKIEGEGLTIGFNNKYMLDALRNCETDEVKILLSGAIRPILIVPHSGDSFLFLILPVRLKNEDKGEAR